MEIIAYHGDRRGIYTFDKRRIRKRDDNIKGWYFCTEKRIWIANYYDDNPHKYTLHINNPIYDYRPSFRKVYSKEELQGHDAIIAVFKDDNVCEIDRRNGVGKGDIIEIIVLDKKIIEEML